LQYHDPKDLLFHAWTHTDEVPGGCCCYPRDRPLQPHLIVIVALASIIVLILLQFYSTLSSS
jgi:hypothetical protein